MLNSEVFNIIYHHRDYGTQWEWGVARLW